MRRRLVHAVTWTLATSAAVLLAWFGVHTVMAGTAYDPPRALPVSQPGGTSSAVPQVSSTHRPKPPSAPPQPSASAPRPRGTRASGSGGHSGAAGDGGGASGGNGPASQTSSPPEDRSASARTGNVRGVDVTGGRAVFDVGQHSATLVSATPESGWAMQVWRTPTWIRVTFSQGETAHSVFCRWDDGTPHIETYAG